MSNLFTELKRRNIFRVAGVYAVVGWLLMQFASILETSIGLPEWFDGMVVALLLIGFPIALIFAWAFELTPEGMKRTVAVGEGESIRDKTGRKLDFAILGGLVLVIGLAVFQISKPDASNTQIAASEIHDASIAVLPFADMSAAGDQEYFGDGIAEEILNVLVDIPKLKVAGRTSSFSFKGKNEDLREIGSALGVEHVLEGSIRRSGTKLRITAQLIRGEDGFHLWSETYDREMTDIFEIQDEIARAVADQLAVSLGLSNEPLVNERTEDLQAYESYLKAHQLFLKRGKDNLDQALLLANEAVARDPDFAPAWSTIADIYSVYETYQTGPVEENVYLRWRETGKAAANRAVSLDPNGGQHHANIASFYSIERRWEETLTAFDKALELSPNDADVLDSYAQNQIEVGYYARAHKASKRAVEIDPLVPLYRATLARTYFFIGDDEMGQRGMANTIRLNPNLPFVYNYWRNYYRVGEYEKAYGLIEQAISKGVFPTETRQDLENLKAAEGDEEKLRALLPAFARQNDSFLLRQLGEFEPIMDTLDTIWESETRPNPHVFTEIVPPELFTFERWKQEVRKEGILDLWRERGFPAHCRPLTGDDFECDNYQEASR